MNENSNLEFRKIPSLQFLYEVNSNGTIIRNVKSKRHLKLFKKSHNSKTEYWCTQVNIKHHVREVFVHCVVAECWHGGKIQPVKLISSDGTEMYFETSRRAAVFLAEKYEKKVKSFCDKLHLRRKHIFDYDVVYC